MRRATWWAFVGRAGSMGATHTLGYWRNQCGAGWVVLAKRRGWLVPVR